MFHVVDSNVIDVRLVQGENANFPMDVTELPKVTDARESQVANAYCPMDPLGMVTDVRAWHPINA